MNDKEKELIKRFKLEGHPENGLFKEVHYEDNTNERPASGSIYYYLQKDVKAKFHRIDCDEYWIYVSGEDLQIWMIDEEGKLKSCAEVPPEYQGLDRYEARKKIVDMLQYKGFLLRIKDHEHNVGKCQRCNTTIEPLLSEQWFVKMEPLVINCKHHFLLCIRIN